MSAPLANLFSSAPVQNEINDPQVATVISDAMIATPLILTVPDALAHIKDRPIGLTPEPPVLPVSAIYRDRHVMITKEKLAGLAPGASTTLAIGLGEADFSFAGAMYVLYLRVDRTQ